MFDGDTIFAVSVPSNLERKHLDITVAGSIAAEVLAESIVRGVKSEKSLPDCPCSTEWQKD